MPPKIGGASPPVPLPDSQSRASQHQTSEVTGSLGGLKVKVGTNDTGSGVPSTHLLQGSTHGGLGNATLGAEQFINRPSGNIRQGDTRKAGRLARVGRFLSWMKRGMVKHFFKQRNNVAQHTPQAGSLSAPTPADMTVLFAQSARQGIDATKNILNQQVVGEQHDTAAVLNLLVGGDGGLRRAMTALLNICKHLKPEQSPPESLPGTPEQWRAQTEAISQMAQQIGRAEFSENVQGEFTQYGTPSNNPFTAVADRYPQLDHSVRNWLAEGVDLLDQLLTAQERAGKGLPPLTSKELAELKEQVEKFTNPGLRDGQTETPAFTSKMGMDDAVEKIDKVYQGHKTQT